MGNDFLNQYGRGWLVAEMSHTTIAQPQGWYVWPDDMSMATLRPLSGGCRFPSGLYRVGNKPDNPIAKDEMKVCSVSSNNPVSL